MGRVTCLLSTRGLLLMSSSHGPSRSPYVRFPRFPRVANVGSGRGRGNVSETDGGKTIIFPLIFLSLILIVLPLLTHCLLPLDDNILEIQELSERNVDEG